MSGRRRPAEVGASAAPDLGPGEVEPFAADELDPRFELEGVRLEDVDLQGIEAGAGSFDQVLLSGVELSGAKLRGVQMTDVRACRLGAANGDWGGGSLSQVELGRLAADRARADFQGATLRGSELALAGSLLGLRGAVIDSLQLMGLAPTIAHEIGIVVEQA
jgi:pentapeptide repeat protein